MIPDMKRLMIAALVLTVSCTTGRVVSNESVGDVLDRWHHAAAVADEETYFGLMTANAVFLGTDGTERWTREELRDWSARYFDRDSAWVYEPLERHVIISEDGDTAWFDESLRSLSYGSCRGSGVMVLQSGEWRIAQYHLVIPIPNDLADGIVATIRAGSEGKEP